jgi:hypothetical protein
LVVSYITLYYSTIIAYAFYYLFASFSLVMPWSNCNNEWNTPLCLDQIKSLESTNATQARIANMTHAGGSLTTPAEEYFNRRMLGMKYNGFVLVILGFLVSCVYSTFEPKQKVLI